MSLDPLLVPPIDSITGKAIRENNVGGVHYAIFLPFKYIEKFPVFLNNVLLADQILHWVYMPIWFSFDFFPGSASLQWNEIITDEGSKYEITLSGKISKDYDARWRVMKRQENEQYCIIVVDNNGNARIMGYFDLHGGKHGPKITKKFNTGEKPEDSNTFLFTAKMVAVDPPVPCYYAEAVVDDGFPIVNTHGGPVKVPPTPPLD